jgi:hypothetical protein
MKYWLSPCLAFLCLLGACAPVTPEERIARSPALFDSLPAAHQHLVSRGEIARGMSPAAVTLAWGTPSRRYNVVQQGAATERWDYFGSEPVMHNHLSYSHGYRYGYGRRGYYDSLAFSPEINYVPYRRATVLFKNQKVESWERMQ